MFSLIFQALYSFPLLQVTSAIDVETSLFPGHVTLSPSHSSHTLPTTASPSRQHHDVATMSSSQPDLGGIPSQTSSLLSLHGSGVAGIAPGQLSAGAHAAVGSLIVEEVQSLHALCEWWSVCVSVCVSGGVCV